MGEVKISVLEEGRVLGQGYISRVFSGGENEGFSLLLFFFSLFLSLLSRKVGGGGQGGRLFPGAFFRSKNSSIGSKQAWNR